MCCMVAVVLKSPELLSGLITCRNYKAMQRSGWLMDWEFSERDLEVSYIRYTVYCSSC